MNAVKKGDGETEGVMYNKGAERSKNTRKWSAKKKLGDA